MSGTGEYDQDEDDVDDLRSETKIPVFKKKIRIHSVWIVDWSTFGHLQQWKIAQ